MNAAFLIADQTCVVAGIIHDSVFKGNGPTRILNRSVRAIDFLPVFRPRYIWQRVPISMAFQFNHIADRFVDVRCH